MKSGALQHDVKRIAVTVAEGDGDSHRPRRFADHFLFLSGHYYFVACNSRIRSAVGGCV